MSELRNSPSQSAVSNTLPSRRVSLSTKLPTTIISLLLIALSIYTFLSIRLSRQALTDTLEGELQDQTATKVQVIQADLLAAQAVSLQLASFAEIETNEEADIVRMLRNTLKRNESIFGSAIAFEPNQFKESKFYYAPYFSRTSNGTPIFIDVGTPEYDYFNKSWYRFARDTGRSVLSPPYFNTGANIWMVTWSTPFFKSNGDLKGVATADITFQQTQELVNSIKVGENGYAFLLNKNGIILGIGENGGEYYTMSSSMIAAAYTEKTERWIELVTAMRAGETGFIEATDPRGEPMLVAYAPIGLDTDWSLALAYSNSELIASTSRLRNTLLGYTAGVLLLFSAFSLAFTRSITVPLRQLREFASRVSGETLSRGEQEFPAQIQIRTQDELEDLGNAFNQMSENLRMAFGTLEEKVETRTKDLARLANELQSIAEVNRELAVIRDQNTLLNVSASLIRERFGYYHVGIFLADDKGEYAFLRGASSVAAEKMIASNYKLKIGETGMIGNVARTGQAHIAQDVDLDTMHINNPYLPETRSEITLPLRSFNVTIGALDIQSKASNAFDQQDLQTLQVLADQLTAAIENAQLVQRLGVTLSELSRANQTNTRQVWHGAVGKQASSAYEYDGLQIRPIPQDLPSELITQLEAGHPITLRPGETNSKNTLLVPLSILGQVFGVVGLEQDDPSKPWSEEQIAIAQAAANRAALTLENARLFEESNRRSSKESTIFSATHRISTALSMENILQTTAEELEKILSGSEITIQFSDDESAGKQPEE